MIFSAKSGEVVGARPRPFCLSELVSCQEPGPQLCVGVGGQRRLHEVGHEVDGGLWQGSEHVVVTDVLVVGVPQDRLPIGHGEPGDDVVGPEGRQLDVLVVRGGGGGTLSFSISL